jgi:hypothetical protein
MTVFVMAEFKSSMDRKRTAVLAVHGIGSQRALETVRGVIRGVWLDPNDPEDKGKRLWTHPERSGVDIDLSVMTTNEVPESRDKVIVDFHELYWAHLMSETKAVAVLLWLYELCRKGPIMRPGINGLWWSAAIFLCLMNLSFSLLVLRATYQLSQTSAQNILVAPFLLLLASIVFGIWRASRWRAYRLIKWLALFCGAGLLLIGGYFLLEWAVPGEGGMLDGAELVTLTALPTLVAGIATFLVMGREGMRAFGGALVVSLIVCFAFILSDRHWYPQSAFAGTIVHAWPWGLNAPWGVPLAFGVLGLYLAANAAFLQPYLGDAARYFRGSPANVAVRRAIRKEAVDTLERLHTSGQYDRIIIVAHSLGCVVSYDMLRTYFSRVCDELPSVDLLGPELDEVDHLQWSYKETAKSDDKKFLRSKARQIIANIADATVYQPPSLQPAKSWLVTDFVTLGSALSHAYFLMCDGNSHDKLKEDFARRVTEREFPTCPPARLDQDGLLTFNNPKRKTRQIHHGALFALTRWTNIYFPMVQIFWGDAIGGPVAPIFGRHIVDLPVSTSESGAADFFTHTLYWNTEREPDRWNAPQIVALRNAVDLAEQESAIKLVNRGVEVEDGEAG